jgi:hypothetical protein
MFLSSSSYLLFFRYLSSSVFSVFSLRSLRLGGEPAFLTEFTFNFAQASF